MNYGQLKDWEREEHRLTMANSAGVDIDDIFLPGDDDPNLNIILRLSREAEVDSAMAHADGESWSDDRIRPTSDGAPSLEDMMFFDMLDGSIDGEFDVI
jgi:hypothetical protein